MEETIVVLREILDRIDGIIADVRGIHAQVEGTVSEIRGTSSHCSHVPKPTAEAVEASSETNARLEKIEERLDYLAAKWMEHDEEIHRIKRRQA